MERMESVGERPPTWVRPNLRNERGELERVVREFLDQEPTQQNIEALFEVLNAAPLTELSEENWKSLENADSFRKITPGQLDEAEQLTEKCNQELAPDKRRDFGRLLLSFRSGKDMESPAIVRKNGRLYLVSGNTRLMISRGLRIRPMVLIGDIG